MHIKTDVFIKYLINEIKVQRGDIVNFHGDFPVFAPLVRAATRGPEGHSAIITDIDIDDNEIILTEALTKVVSTKLSSAINKGCRFNIYRVKEWNQFECRIAAEKARLLSETPYAYKQIAGFYIGLLTDVSTENPFLEYDANGQLKTIFCSQLVVWSYFKAAKVLNKKPIVWRQNIHWSMSSPNDIGYFSERTKCIYKGIIK